jgi:hypothetical protein
MQAQILARKGRAHCRGNIGPILFRRAYAFLDRDVTEQQARLERHRIADRAVGIAAAYRDEALGGRKKGGRLRASGLRPLGRNCRGSFRDNAAASIAQSATPFNIRVQS